MEYSMAYDNGVSKLQQNEKEDLLWFMSMVHPTIQKQYKLLWFHILW